MNHSEDAGGYSTDEIHRLLQRVRAEHHSAASTVSPSGNSSAKVPEASAAPSDPSQKKPQPDSNLGVSQELSLEEIYNKIRREIAEG